MKIGRQDAARRTASAAADHSDAPNPHAPIMYLLSGFLKECISFCEADPIYKTVVSVQGKRLTKPRIIGTIPPVIEPPSLRWKRL